MIQLVVCIISSLIGLIVTALCLKNWHTTGSTKNFGVLLFMLTFNSIHIVITLSYILYDKLFLFGVVTPPLAALNVLTFGSIIFTVPFLAHSLFDTPAAHKINLFFFFYFSIFVLINFIGLYPVGAGVTIATYGALMFHSIYAGIYFFINGSRLAGTGLSRSREFWYGMNALIVLVLSSPFLGIADFTLIPQRALMPRCAVLPWEVLAQNIGFLIVTLSGLSWMKDNRHRSGAPSASTMTDRKLQLARYGLSPRELEVLPLVLENRPYKEIAELLFISLATVKTHILSIYQKTKTAGRQELLALFDDPKQNG